MEKTAENRGICRIQIPTGASDIIRVLEEHGFEGYVVGGCVRDALLGREPHDWDITTSAQPLQVREMFRRTVDTGIAHGTVTVLIGDEAYEVTTYRIDGTYRDGRHPDSVTFTPSLEEDLKRRDFTINAMAFNEKRGLVDLFDGEGDLGRSMVRCVGDPRERFREDALRIMRAVRFAAQLGFELDEETAKAAASLAPTLARISAERVRDELVKLICSDRPQLLDTARQLGITQVILPEYDSLFQVPLRKEPHAGLSRTQNTGRSDDHIVGQDRRERAGHSYEENAGEHTLQTMCNIDEQDPEKRELLRLAMLLHDTGKAKTVPAAESGVGSALKYPGHAAQSEQEARRILRRLKFDNETIRVVTTLIRFHTDLPEAEPAAVRRMMHAVGPDLFPMWLQVKQADILAQSEKKKAGRLKRLEEIREISRQIRQRGDPLSLPDLAITGKDLIGDGMRPGPQLGRVLGALLEEVLEDPSVNTRENLIGRSRELRTQIAETGPGKGRNKD